MAIQFPNNPTLNQTYTYNTITWTYNGKGWTKSTGGTVTVTPADVSDKPNTSTGYFDLPMGTTAQRPVSPANGNLRFNIDAPQSVELYYNSFWNPIAYVRPGMTAAYPATSATQLAGIGVTTNGNYWISINGTATQCYVDFNLAGGPYILVMVAASTGSVYGYDSTVWTNTTGGLTTGLDPTIDTDQVHEAFYTLPTSRTGLALHQPSTSYFHFLDHVSGTARALSTGSTAPTAVSPNSTTIQPNNIIPSTSPAKALGWWNAVTAAGFTAQTNGATFYRYGYSHGTPEPSMFGYCRFGFTADQDSSDSRDRGIGIGIKNAGGGPVATYAASAGRWDYNDGNTGYKNNLKGYLYVKN